jgi:N-acetylmuramoyl-L-alanine amidase
MLKNFMKNTFAFLVVFLVVFSISEKGQAETLPDIPTTAADEINYLLGKGIIMGYEDGTFKPTRNVTRAEAAIMLGKALDLNGTERETSFKDVAAGSKASGYIQSLVDRDIINGYTDGTFQPSDPISRVEMAYILVRGLQLEETSNVNFSDVPKSGDQYDAINKIATAGLTIGYPDGTYHPTNNVTRQDYAVFLARGLNPDYRVSYIGVGQPIEEAVVNVASWDVLNVRSGAGTNYSIVGKLNSGAKVSIYRHEGEWSYIQSGNISGYVNNYYLSSPSDNTIAIDPGHGGSDPGAIANGIYEKELNLDVSLRVEKLLKAKGIGVVMTRRDDTYPSLSKRVEIAVNSNADAFVSIHGNKFTQESASGTETYYSTASTRADDSKQLATFIQNRLYPALGTKNRGVKTADYQVIYKNPLPASLVELGFISNDSDASKLSSNYYRDKAAEAIALGIQDYYNSK